MVTGNSPPPSRPHMFEDKCRLCHPRYTHRKRRMIKNPTIDVFNIIIIIIISQSCSPTSQTSHPHPHAPPSSCKADIPRDPAATPRCIPCEKCDRIPHYHYWQWWHSRRMSGDPRRPSPRLWCRSVDNRRGRWSIPVCCVVD